MEIKTLTCAHYKIPTLARGLFAKVGLILNLVHVHVPQLCLWLQVQPKESDLNFTIILSTITSKLFPLL